MGEPGNRRNPKKGMDKPQIFVYQEELVDFSCFSCSWLPVSSKFAVVGSNARNEGILATYQVDRDKISCQNKLQMANAARCYTFDFCHEDQRQIAIGNCNGSVEIRDIEKPDHPTYSIQGHESIVNSIDGAGG